MRILSCLLLAVAGSAFGEEATIVYRSQFDKEVSEERWSDQRTVKSPKGAKVLLGEFHSRQFLSLRLTDLPDHKFVRFKAKLHLLRSPTRLK